MTDLLLVETADHVCRLTLNRPEKHNAINPELRLGLIESLEAVIADDDVRVIVLAGAGRSFCAGQDLDELKSDAVPHEQRRLEHRRILDLLRSSPKPVIARCHGHTAGSGMLLAMHCDLRIAGAESVIGMTEMKFGLPMMIGSDAIRNIVGDPAMRRIVLYADFIPAPEALRLGLITEAVPEAGLDARIDEVATLLASRNTEAMRRTKAAWAAYSEGPFNRMYDDAPVQQNRLLPVWKD